MINPYRLFRWATRRRRPAVLLYGLAGVLYLQGLAYTALAGLLRPFAPKPPTTTTGQTALADGWERRN